MQQSFVSAALLEVLVCPLCHQKLEQVGEDAAWLHCLGCARHYPIEDGLAVMLEERATYKPAKDDG